MTRILLNETLRTLLPNLSRLVLFCDESGKVLGYFFPDRPLFRMTRVIVNETLRSLLPDLSHRFAFFDQHGTVIGRFHPDAPLYIGEEPPPFLEEELETDEPTYTTAEVLAYLESLETGIE